MRTGWMGKGGGGWGSGGGRGWMGSARAVGGSGWGPRASEGLGRPACWGRRQGLWDWAWLRQVGADMKSPAFVGVARPSGRGSLTR